jgi:hypothetical protein
MNHYEYLSYWKNVGEKLNCISEEYLASIRILSATRAFLQSIGLPEDVTPSLTFSEVKEQLLLTPNKMFPLDYPELDRYLVIGFNGCGDPVCIDTVIADQIVYLNHDNYFERIFINSSISQLGYSLTYYRDFIESIISTTVGDFTRRKFSESEYQDLRIKFTENDPYCLDENTFWQSELAYLKWERENDNP